MSSAPLTLGVGAAGNGLRRYRILVFTVAFLVALMTVLVIWRNQSAVAQTDDIYKFADLGQNITAGNRFQTAAIWPIR
jgi:multidrug resistance efflux pump